MSIRDISHLLLFEYFAALTPQDGELDPPNDRDGIFMKRCGFATEMSRTLHPPPTISIEIWLNAAIPLPLLLHPGLSAFSISLPHAVAPDRPRAFAT